MPSYQLLATRFEAADQRTQSVLTFSATIALGIPALAKAVRPELSLESPWLWAAVAVFALIAGLGVLSRACGTLRLIGPDLLYKNWLHRKDWDFKKDMVYFAGEDFKDNVETIRYKGNCAAVMGALFIAMTGLLFGWLVAGGR
jgi:hypothetical protein